MTWTPSSRVYRARLVRSCSSCHAKFDFLRIIRGNFQWETRRIVGLAARPIRIIHVAIVVWVYMVYAVSNVVPAPGIHARTVFRRMKSNMFAVVVAGE